MGRSKALYLGIGAVAGSAVTALFFLFKEGVIFAGEGPAPSSREDKPVQNDVDSDNPIPFKDASADAREPDIIAYNDILHKQNYKSEEVSTDGGIYEITEAMYFEQGGYDMKSLTLYSDGVIADSTSDEILDSGDIAHVFGSLHTVEKISNALNHGVDILYIRNEGLFTQYEISSDDRTYSEVVG